VQTGSDTIFAVASGYGRAAIAVIRLSGRDAAAVLGTCVAGAMPEPRRAVLRRLLDPASGEVLDQALVLWMPGPHSFTGEDQAELHLHGGTAVRAAVLAMLTRLPGCRAAEPGEFTRRAFINQKLDLSAVEGLADLIDAETEAQRKQALRQLDGALSQRVAEWRDDLIDASAYLEAALDFTDEEDVPADIIEAALTGMTRVSRAIRAVLADGGHGERLRDGFTVVIAGPPNSGKSTLLNTLARRDVAIVSPYAGTTRDAIEVRCDLGGLPVVFVDTAGLRETLDPVEHEGISRTRAHLRAADLVLWLTPGDAAIEASVPSPDVPALGVLTKGDLLHDRSTPADTVIISARTGYGMAELIEAVRLRAAAYCGTGDAIISRERHRVALGDVAGALERAEIVLKDGHEELAAEDLRLALRALGRMTGRVDVEEVLDRIFGQFCIGK
jgi:tRNA modification GTPase